MKIRLDHVRQVIRLFEEARELETPDQQRLLQEIVRMVGGTAGAFVTAEDYRAGGRIQPIDAVLCNFDDADRHTVLDAYLPTGGWIDPGIARYAALVSTHPLEEVGPLRRAQLVNDRTWYRTGIVAEVLVPAKLDEFILSGRPTGRPATFHTVTVYRAPGERPFDEDDRNLILLFHLELERLLAETNGRQRRRARRRTAALSRETATAPMLALDGAGRLLWLSPQAERLLGPASGPGGALPDGLLAAARRLSALDGGESLEAAAALVLDGGRTLRAQLSSTCKPDGEPFIAVVLADDAPLADVAARFSLTRAETAVLRHLAHGLPNREIARRLFVSFETVRTHVQRVLGKLGVASRVQAALLVRDYTADQ